MAGLNIPSGTSGALNYFVQFFNSKIIAIIFTNSNSYTELYQDKYPNNYKYYPKNGFNRISFYTFLSIVGLHPQEDYFYWSIHTVFFLIN